MPLMEVPDLALDLINDAIEYHSHAIVTGMDTTEDDVLDHWQSMRYFWKLSSAMQPDFGRIFHRSRLAELIVYACQNHPLGDLEPAYSGGGGGEDDEGPRAMIYWGPNEWDILRAKILELNQTVRREDASQIVRSPEDEKPGVRPVDREQQNKIKELMDRIIVNKHLSHIRKEMEQWCRSSSIKQPHIDPDDLQVFADDLQPLRKKDQKKFNFLRQFLSRNSEPSKPKLAPMDDLKPILMSRHCDLEVFAADLLSLIMEWNMELFHNKQPALYRMGYGDLTKEAPMGTTYAVYDSSDEEDSSDDESNYRSRKQRQRQRRKNRKDSGDFDDRKPPAKASPKEISKIRSARAALRQSAPDPLEEACNAASTARAEDGYNALYPGQLAEVEKARFEAQERFRRIASAAKAAALEICNAPQDSEKATYSWYLKSKQHSPPMTLEEWEQDRRNGGARFAELEAYNLEREEYGKYLRCNHNNRPMAFEEWRQDQRDGGSRFVELEYEAIEKENYASYLRRTPRNQQMNYSRWKFGHRQVASLGAAPPNNRRSASKGATPPSTRREASAEAAPPSVRREAFAEATPPGSRREASTDAASSSIRREASTEAAPPSDYAQHVRVKRERPSEDDNHADDSSSSTSSSSSSSSSLSYPRARGKRRGKQENESRQSSRKRRRHEGKYAKKKSSHRIDFGDSEDDDDAADLASVQLSNLPNFQNTASPGKRRIVINKKPRQRRKFWSKEEKSAIREGIRRYGEGKWVEIRDSFPEVLGSRTNVQIKDCARTMRNNGEL